MTAKTAKTTTAADTPADATTADTVAPAPVEPTYFAVRDFRDAGTEDSFARGEEVSAPKGRMANYAAAGLVTTDTPAVTGE